MKPRNRIIFITLSAFVLSAFFGCARFAASDEKLTEMEKKISIGASEGDFKTNMPSAQLVDELGNKKVYVVVVTEECFICSSAKAFQRSFETYATQFTFEDGKLVSFKRIGDGR